MIFFACLITPSHYSKHDTVCFSESPSPTPPVTVPSICTTVEEETHSLRSLLRSGQEQLSSKWSRANVADTCLHETKWFLFQTPSLRNSRLHLTPALLTISQGCISASKGSSSYNRFKSLQHKGRASMEGLAGES